MLGYRDIRKLPKALLGVEVTMLVGAFRRGSCKSGRRICPRRAPDPGVVVVEPFGGSFSHFVDGLTLMLFIYWGWEHSVSVNEETANKHVFPGRAAVISTVVLLAVYELVIVSAPVLRRPW